MSADRNTKIEKIEGRMSEKTFVICFFNDLAKLKGLSAYAILLFQQLALRCDYDNEFLSNKYLKKKLCDLIGIKNVSSYDDYMSTFKKKGLIVKVSAGTYRVNPEYFAKGTLEDIRLKRKEFDELVLETTYNKKYPAGKLRIKIKTKKTRENTQEIQKPVVKISMLPVTTKNVHALADGLFKRLVQKHNVYLERHAYLEPFFTGIAEDLANGNRPLKSGLNIRTFTAYLEKTFLRELDDINENSDKTVYKKTKERLTDYAWAEGLDC